MKADGSEAKKVMADSRRIGDTGTFNDDTFFTRLLGDAYVPESPEGA